MASHPVYDYLSRRYGLSLKSVHWEPDEAPTNEQWMDLRRILKDHPAKWMIWEAAPLQKSQGSVVYCNFEEDSGLDQLFQRDLNPERILAELSIYMNVEIHPGSDLIIFDEIQISSGALNSLKYFSEQRPDVHMAAADSLLGVKLSSPGSFPVGKVNFLHLYPMKFLEFLDAMGESRYGKLIENIDRLVPITEAFHSHLIDLLSSNRPGSCARIC